MPILNFIVLASPWARFFVNGKDVSVKYKRFMIKQHAVYIWDNVSLLLLSNINSSMHKHSAFEIYIALDSYFLMDWGNGFKKYKSLIINSNIPHKFSGNNGAYALILINRNHELSNYLLHNILKGNPYKKLNPDPFQDIITLLSFPHSEKLNYKSGKDLTEKIIVRLTNNFQKKTSIDPRIEKAISIIHSSVKDPIKLSSLAKSTNLSESRIRHLFKEETGLSVRQYIANKRIIEALKLIIDGCSKTYAAHEVGFSDLAHLSRTFKSFYGLTLSDLYRNDQISNIQYCPKQH